MILKTMKVHNLRCSTCRDEERKKNADALALANSFWKSDLQQMYEPKADHLVQYDYITAVLKEDDSVAPSLAERAPRRTRKRR